MVVLSYLAVCLIWGTTYLVIRIALEGFPPFVLGAVRFGIASLFFLPYLLRDRSKLPKSKSQWGWIALTGTMMLAGGNGLVNFAEQYIDSGMTALTVATSSAWSALFGWLLIGESEKLDKLSLLGIAMAMSGIVVLHYDHIGLATDEWPGFVALVLCPPMWTFASVMVRKHLRDLDPFVVSAGQMLAGALAFVVISLAVGESWRIAPDAKAIGAMLYLAVLGSVVAFTAYTYLLSKVPAARANTYTFINPIIALAAGAMILDEPITPEVYPATLLILAGLGILYVMRNRRQASSK